MTGQARAVDDAGANSPDQLDALLDEALADTFPASDPFSVGQSTSTEPPARPLESAAPGGEPLDSDLDQALEDTFPASDPIAVGRATGTEPPARPPDRAAPVLAPERKR